MKKFGMINIGDTPITGIEKDVKKYFPQAAIYQYGALDGMSEEELQQNVNWNGNGHLLTVQLSNGKFIKLDKEKLVPYIQKTIEKAESQGILVNYIHCTSVFPEFKRKGILMEPGKILKTVAKEVKGKVLVCTPTKAHIPQVNSKWDAFGIKADVFAIEPFDYNLQEMINLKEKANGYKAVVLDCASYNMEFSKEIAQTYQGIIINALDLSLAICSTLVMF